MLSVFKTLDLGGHLRNISYCQFKVAQNISSTFKDVIRRGIKKLPITGEHVCIIFVTKSVALATL